jgi:hypothetical protein
MEEQDNKLDFLKSKKFITTIISIIAMTVAFIFGALDQATYLVSIGALTGIYNIGQSFVDANKEKSKPEVIIKEAKNE